eukprot:1518443-Amphidinium_carterae.2
MLLVDADQSAFLVENSLLSRICSAAPGHFCGKRLGRVRVTTPSASKSMQGMSAIGHATTLEPTRVGKVRSISTHMTFISNALLQHGGMHLLWLEQ